jgi:hypothetical protein
MARLRDDAHHMPPSQLNGLLAQEWGPDWRSRFANFEIQPIAAASIGQVHRAVTREGRELAIKVQYPGVRESIDADVDNVATLLRMSGAVPKGLDLGPLLAAAKSQLAEEADYEREGAQMALFGRLLADTPEVLVPALDPALTTSRVLAMSFVDSRPIETLETAGQAVRDAAMQTLMRLVLRELFEFGVMQTDPNFANYRIQPRTGRLVLLDFGAARPVAAATAHGYRRLIRASLAGDREAVRQAAVDAGFLGAAAVDRHPARIDAMIDVILGELNRPGLFDFGDRRFVGVLRDEGMEVAADPAAATWSLRWRSHLFNVSGRALTLGNPHSHGGMVGSHYNGLQFRGARELLDDHLDPTIKLVAEGGLEGVTAVHGASARWMAWHGQLDGSLRRVRLRFENNTGPLTWFVRRNYPLAAFPLQAESDLVLAPGAELLADHTLTFQSPA